MRHRQRAWHRRRLTLPCCATAWWSSWLASLCSATPSRPSTPWRARWQSPAPGSTRRLRPPPRRRRPKRAPVRTLCRWSAEGSMRRGRCERTILRRAVLTNAHHAHARHARPRRRISVRWTPPAGAQNSVSQEAVGGRAPQSSRMFDECVSRRGAACTGAASRHPRELGWQFQPAGQAPRAALARSCAPRAELGSSPQRGVVPRVLLRGSPPPQCGRFAFWSSHPAGLTRARRARPSAQPALHAAAGQAEAVPEGASPPRQRCSSSARRWGKALNSGAPASLLRVRRADAAFRAGAQTGMASESVHVDFEAFQARPDPARARAPSGASWAGSAAWLGCAARPHAAASPRAHRLRRSRAR